MTLIELILAAGIIVSLYVGYQALKSHNTFKAQAQADLAALKAKVGL